MAHTLFLHAVSLPLILFLSFSPSRFVRLSFLGSAGVSCRCPKDQWSTRGRVGSDCCAFSPNDSLHCELRSAECVCVFECVWCANSLICRARASYQQCGQCNGLQRLLTANNESAKGRERGREGVEELWRQRATPARNSTYQCNTKCQYTDARRFLSIYAYQLNSL